MKQHISTATLTIVLCVIGLDANGQDQQRSEAASNDVPLEYSIQRSVMTNGYDGESCWVHARAGIIPANSSQHSPTVVMTTQRLQLSGSDVFYALHSAHSEDLGATWSPLVPQNAFRRWPADGGTEETVCDFTPQWHQKSRQLVGIGHTVRYSKNKVMKAYPRYTSYSVYDESTHKWAAPKLLQMPKELRFVNSGAGSVQRFDLPNGDILLPVYFKDPSKTQYSVTVCRCRFDGEELKYASHGSELTVNVKRGLYEPSITKFGDRFYLTMRNDDHGYVTSSSDGQQFDEPVQWKFDDGEILGNYNTQQHWLTHSDGLFLVYTRKGANNDHVFRHRAPLFVAQVDPKTLRVIRSTEQIAVPERGARLGNFGVVNVTPTESWIVVAEWMQTWRRPSVIIPVDNKYGADNSVHIARIKWTSPNRLFTE